jgi:DNA-binding MltR family transcriptional regulator
LNIEMFLQSIFDKTNFAVLYVLFNLFY